MKRKYPTKMFCFFVLMDFIFHFLHLFVPGIILCIVGIWVKTCLWIGLIILGIDLILSIIEQLRIRKAAITQSDNPVFNEFMDAFCGPGGLNDVRKVLDLKIKSQNLADADNQFSVVSHYDLLIDEGNDPVHDSTALQDYMDKWDGPTFIDQMQLDKNKSVFEIGVGTGRLATRVAPLCGEFYGVDISHKTIERAKENLAEYSNVTLTCVDFSAYDVPFCFDVIYSSLTFMHIKDKEQAVKKIAGLLKQGGRFVLSIDRNPSEFIDMGSRKIKIYPDTVDVITKCNEGAGLTIINQYDTEFATIFVAIKE